MKLSNPSPVVGFSFSPGGLLLPYHLGVLDSLAQTSIVPTAPSIAAAPKRVQPALTHTTPLAGSSAGAIAVACHACRLPSAHVLEATVALSDECAVSGGAQGRLIPALRRQMQRLIGPEQLDHVQNRRGAVGIAYQQLFPTVQPILQTTFGSVDDLIDAVSFSSTFPFFSDTWPVALDRRGRSRPGGSFLPRVVVDGFFTEPRNRLGCPDLNRLVVAEEADASILEEEKSDDDNDDNLPSSPSSSSSVTEVLVTCFPQDSIGLTAVPPERCISPPLHALDGITNNNGNDNGERPTGMAAFLQCATETSSAATYFRLYEQGLADGEAWCTHVAPRLLCDSPAEEMPLN